MFNEICIVIVMIHIAFINNHLYNINESLQRLRPSR